MTPFFTDKLTAENPPKIPEKIHSVEPKLVVRSKLKVLHNIDSKPLSDRWHNNGSAWKNNGIEHQVCWSEIGCESH